jgi:type II secretory pathway pseudopilin PulG
MPGVVKAAKGHKCDRLAVVLRSRSRNRGSEALAGRFSAFYDIDGMTLLEVMIACGIMGVALVMLMSSLINISATGSSAEERAMAASHASSVLEEVHATDRTGLLAYRAPTFRGLRRETITVQYVNTAGGLVTLPVATGAVPPAMPNPVEVRVRSQWQSKDRHFYRVAASTFIRW